MIISFLVGICSKIFILYKIDILLYCHAIWKGTTLMQSVFFSKRTDRKLYLSEFQILANFYTFFINSWFIDFFLENFKSDRKMVWTKNTSSISKESLHFINFDFLMNSNRERKWISIIIKTIDISIFFLYFALKSGSEHQGARLCKMHT